MKVSEVKKKIKELQRCLDNVNRLREYFDGRTGAEEYEEIQEKLEEGAGLNCMVRSLSADVADVLYGEIGRLEKAVNDADAQV